MHFNITQMKPSHSDIVRYLANSLSAEENTYFVDRIINDEEFAKEVLKVKAIIEKARDKDIVINMELFIMYVNNELDPDAESEYEKFLHETSDRDFYQEFIKSNIKPEFSISNEGRLNYTGNDTHFRMLTEQINSENSEELTILCEYTLNLRGGHGLEIETPYNNEIIHSNNVIFIAKTDSSVQFLKGWSIKIFKGNSEELDTINFESTEVNYTFQNPGKYFWKLLDPEGQMKLTRRLILVF